MLSNNEIKKIFQSDEEYFMMMRAFHDKCGTQAIPDILHFMVNEELNQLTPGWLVDAGSGEGSVTIRFARRYCQTRFLGVDVSHNGTMLAREKAISCSIQNVDFVVSDLEGLSVKENLIDVVYCQSVLEHVPDWERAIEEVHKALKPGGVLFVEVVNGGWRGSFRECGRIALKYVLGMNRSRRLDSTFALAGTGSMREQSHMTDYDVWEIPSDVLLKVLRKRGFTIEYFTTNRERLFKRERYREGSFWFRSLVKIFVWVPVFPFNHMGGEVIIKARKGAKNPDI